MATVKCDRHRNIVEADWTAAYSSLAGPEWSTSCSLQYQTNHLYSFFITSNLQRGADWVNVNVLRTELLLEVEKLRVHEQEGYEIAIYGERVKLPST